MKQIIFIFLFILCLLNTQTLFAQSSEQSLQELARKIMSDIKNPDETLGLLTDIQDVLQPHSDFLLNTLPEMQTDPEFEPYIEKYETLKGQYLGNGQPMSIHPDVKIFLSITPFPRSVGYDESLIGAAVSFYYNSVVIIDRGFGEYYQDNDEIREVVLFHELGHCDLRQKHGHNDIMNIAWIDGLLHGKTIDWQPLYEEFFVMHEKDKVIVCSEENFHLYEGCSDPRFLFQPLICHEQGNDTICYARRKSLVNQIKNSLSFMECLLFNSNTPFCFG